MNIQGSDLT